MNWSSCVFIYRVLIASCSLCGFNFIYMDSNESSVWWCVWLAEFVWFVQRFKMLPFIFTKSRHFHCVNRARNLWVIYPRVKYTFVLTSNENNSFWHLDSQQVRVDVLYVGWLRELIEFFCVLTCFDASYKCDASPAVVGGAQMRKMLVNCDAVSFADAPLLKVSQTHLLSCQTPQLVIID